MCDTSVHNPIIHYVKVTPPEHLKEVKDEVQQAPEVGAQSLVS